MLTSRIFRRVLAVGVAPVAIIGGLLVVRPAMAAPASITFSGNLSDGSHVRGNETVVLRSDGSFNFSGHLHNYAVPDYNVKVLCVYRLRDGGGVSVQKEGKVHGVLPGSRNLNWADAGHSDELANNFDQLDGTGTCQTSTSATFTDLLTSVGAAAGVVGGIIALF